MKKITGICLIFLTLLLSVHTHAKEPLVQINVLSPEAALELAQATLADCRAAGYQVAVAVVDRMGVSQVVLRDRLAGPHTVDTAQSKAWTAVSFRSDTLSLAQNTGPGSMQSGARMIPNVLMLGGGVPIEVAGQMVGAIGVSGASGGNEDDQCARAGIKAVMEKLELGG